MRKRKGKVFQKLALTLSAAFLLTGCNAVKTGSPDDYATNKGYEQSEGDTAQKGEGGISKDQIKVGVLYLSDPDEGSGYSYTHDLGVKGMQEKQMEVLEAIKMFSDMGLNSTGGLSNNSNGMPKNIRPIMDSALVAMAMMNGLTSAIVNPNDLRLMETIKSCDVFKGNTLYADSYLEI